MRKLLNLLIFLFCVGLFLQCFLVFIGREHHIKYQIVKDGKTFLIEEKYQIVDGKDRYQFVINGNYVFDIWMPLHKTSRLIKDIVYFEDDTYTCIYPVFRSRKINTDILCKDEHLVYYHTIKGSYKKLDTFASSLPNYDVTQFSLQNQLKKKKEFVTVYPDNILDNHFIALQNYRGIYHISKENLVGKKQYYNHDVYEPKLAIAYDKYFISALYKGEDTFDTFIIIRIDKNAEKRLRVPSISTSSTLWEIDGNIYVEDKDNESIYLINPKKNSYQKISQLPKRNLKRKYNNKNYINIVETKYYYYLYKKEESGVKISRIFKDYPNLITDLFTIESIENIKYYDNFIYFVSEGTLYYYSDITGVREVLSYDELKFNKTLSYFVYIK